MDTLAYMLNTKYTSASKLPQSLRKQINMFFDCVDNGNSSLHWAAKWAAQKYWFISQDSLSC